MVDLYRLFNPRGIAIVGASREPNKIGSVILRNLIEAGYEGKIYPINPNAQEIMGLKAYPSISAVEGTVDVAVISVPAPKVPDVIEDAGKAGVKFAVVIASGFKEVGNVALEEEVVKRAKKYGMRVVGPNVFGYVYTPSKINTTFGPNDIIPGNVAFISQSGALGVALMGTASVEGLGISAIISIGNKADLDDSDFIEYLGDDPNTNLILIYMEGISEGQRFMEVASKVSLKKPIIIIKSGRSEAGARAAASHTGSLAGNYSLYKSAFRQSGILLAETIEQAFDWAKALAWNPLPKGDNVVIITNGGGAGVQATDALADYGITLRRISDTLAANLKQILPPFASLGNPIDLTGLANAEWYYQSISLALDDPNVDSLVVIYCRTGMTDPKEIAGAIKDALKSSKNRKPITVAMIGGEAEYEAMRELTREHIPTYPTPERASASMGAIYRYYYAKKYVEERLKELDKKKLTALERIR
ncbi:MAG: CoA-binding protein [Sulfolobaceae archaeon]|nr:CoA-binding protein [Sulfolobaceae archaeon]